MPLQHDQQLPHGPIMRNRIRHRHNGLEPKYPLLITRHHRPLIRSYSTRVLHIIESFTIRLPDIDLYALDRTALRVLDSAEDKAGFAVGVMGNDGAVGGCFGFVRVEGSEDGAFGG
jgi:hypothetical protein